MIVDKEQRFEILKALCNSVPILNNSTNKDEIATIILKTYNRVCREASLEHIA